MRSVLGTHSGQQKWEYPYPHPAMRSIARHCQSESISIRELARRLNRSHKTVEAYFHAVKPKPDTIRMLAKAIDMSDELANWLFFSKNQKNLEAALKGHTKINESIGSIFVEMCAMASLAVDRIGEHAPLLASLQARTISEEIGLSPELSGEITQLSRTISAKSRVRRRLFEICSKTMTEMLSEWEYSESETALIRRFEKI